MRAILLFLICFSSAPVWTQIIEISGLQESQFHYRLEQRIEPSQNVEELRVSFVVPEDIQLSTYHQQIDKINFDFNPPPRETGEYLDERGNRVSVYTWMNPTRNVRAIVDMDIRVRVDLQKPLNLQEIRLPLQQLPPEVAVYLKPTDLVQSDDQRIIGLAHSLTQSSKSTLEAVRSVLEWVAQSIDYVLTPEKFDAVYTLESRRGNCQNFSHLSAALLRALGIPVRIVNGITLDKPYELETGDRLYNLKMAKGRHSWIEVYFPGPGWIPFDPQQSEFFVSSRYIRIEVGLDNAETIQDGLVRWRQSKGTKKQPPGFEEIIESNFKNDKIALAGVIFQPRVPTILLTAPVTLQGKSLQARVPLEPKKEKKAVPPAELPDITRLNYSQPFVYGNLNFPEGQDLTFRRDILSGREVNEYELARNFLVETAEYVTSNQQFIQAFQIPEPIRLEKIGVALHNFGGSGYLWITLYEDENGEPGPPAVRSQKISLEKIHTPRGYYWVDFDFTNQGIILSPDTYWFSLDYEGSPIVNWFYSYGKTIGPADGTRSRKRGEASWKNVLNFEFVYRILGKKAAND